MREASDPLEKPASDPLEQPEPNISLQNYRSVANCAAFKGEPPEWRYLRELKKSSPGKFEDNLMKLERAHSMELAAWRKQLAVREAKGEAGASGPSKKPDEGTRKVIEMTTKILAEIRAKADKEFPDE